MIISGGMTMKRLVSLIISISILFTMSSVVFADERITFSDVKPENWYYEAVMAMSGDKYSLFNGTTKVVNNVGTFSPNSPISRIQLITVLVRYLYPDAAAELGGAKPWYLGYYNFALEKGLIDAENYPLYSGFLNDPITRQETAGLIMSAFIASGETLPSYSLVDSSVSDFEDVSEKYAEAVRRSYIIGIFGGKGTRFDPLSGLTRAEAAQVIYRLAEPSKRILGERNFNISFEQGTEHPKCVPGDVVLSGSKAAVLVSFRNTEILYGSDGRFYDYVSETKINETVYSAGDISWYDSSVLIKDSLTGAVFSRVQWELLQNALYPIDDGIQIGETRNTWYLWTAGDIITGYYWRWIGPEI